MVWPSAAFLKVYSGHRLFLPVPQAKDKLNNNDEIDHKILWEGFIHEMGNGEKEEVLTVEEVVEVPEKLNSRSLCTWDFLEVASFSFFFFNFLSVS